MISINEKENLANEIESAVMVFFMGRRGFVGWLYSMDGLTQKAFEKNLTDCIYNCISPDNQGGEI